MPATVYYDGECPFCTRYVGLLRLNDTLGDEARLVDLRQCPSAREQLRNAGMDVDKGMVLELDGQLHGGDEAIHRLALLSTSSNIFNRLSRAILGNRQGAHLVYPLLRIGRNMALFALGRSRIEAETQTSRAPWILFHSIFGLFALVHSLIYTFKFKPPGYPSTWLLGALGLWLVARPESLRLAAAVLLTLAVDAWAQLPMHSNHTVIKNFLLLGMGACALRQLWKGGTWTAFYEDFAPVGRVLLVVMYVFGVFHKINTGFLDPQASCAVALWRTMPDFLRWIDFPAFHYAAIYGTLVIETVILACLLFRRTRIAAIGAGIAFHSLLALSGYAMYVTFSTLTIALHFLFIERDSAARILASPPWQALQARLRTAAGLGLPLAWALLLAFLAWNGSYSQASLAWLPVPAFLAWVIFRHGGNDVRHAPATRMLWSRCLPANLVSLLFLLNGFAPYLGLKTAQSLNMFANLRLEAGVSNHLVFRDAPGPFGYLADTVEIVAASGSPYLAYIRSNDLRVTYYDLLDTLEREPQVRVDFRRDGQLLSGQDATTLSGEIDAVLHPRWVRSLLHFNPVDLTTPKPCSPNR